MIRAFVPLQHIAGSFVEPLLEKLLERTLGIDQKHGLLAVFKPGDKMAFDKFGGRRVAAIEKNGSSHRLEGTGKDGGLFPAEIGILALAQQQIVAPLKITRHPGQVPLVDQGRPQPGEVALPHLRKMAKKRIAHGEIKHCVAQKLQDLVVLLRLPALFKGMGAVDHGLLQMGAVPEMVAELFLKKGQVWLRCLGKGIGSHGQGTGKG